MEDTVLKADSRLRYTTAPPRARFFLLFFLPLLILILTDKHVLPWDDAFYAQNSVYLAKIMLHRPLKLPLAMLQACSDRPPAIAWVGQLFAVFGFALPLVQTSLLLSVLATQVAAVILLYKSLKQLFASGWPLVITCAFAASGPLFTALTYRYLVEPVQMLAVMWLLFIVAYRDRLTRVMLILQVLSAVSFGLLAKTSTPAFQAPLLLYLLLTFFLKPQDPHKPLIWTGRKSFMTAIAGTLFLVGGTSGWYLLNYQAALRHVIDASTGDLAIYYGSKAPLTTKLVFWMIQFQQVFFWWPLLLFIGLMIPIAVWSRVKRKGNMQPSDILCLLSIATIAGIIFLFARNINQDSRYLFALLPYVAILFAWILVNASSFYWWTAAALLTLAQFVIVTSQSFGIVPPRPDLNGYLAPYVTNDASLRACQFAVRQTMDATTAHGVFVGEEMPDFSAGSLNFYRTVQQPKLLKEAVFIGGDWTQKDVEPNWQLLLMGTCKYFTYRVQTDAEASEFLNRLSKPMLAKVAASSSFNLNKEKSNPRVMIFERAHNRPSYNLVATGQAAGSHPAIASGQVFQGTNPMAALPFGLLEIPKINDAVNLSSGTLSIVGWAVGTTPVTRVSFELDGRKIPDASFVARPDVVKAYPSLKTTGFSLKLDASAVTGGPHKLTGIILTSAGAARLFASVPFYIDLDFQSAGEEGSRPFGILDNPSRQYSPHGTELMQVSGWVASKSPVVSVDIIVDAQTPRPASITARPDVAKAYPKWKTAGFTYPMDLASLPQGFHQVSVFAHADDGSSRTIAHVSFNRSVE